MVRKETEQDEISRLLDSYEDETLNQKMDAFAQSKKRIVNKNPAADSHLCDRNATLYQTNSVGCAPSL